MPRSSHIVRVSAIVLFDHQQVCFQRHFSPKSMILLKNSLGRGKRALMVIPGWEKDFPFSSTNKAASAPDDLYVCKPLKVLGFQDCPADRTGMRWQSPCIRKDRIFFSRTSMRRGGDEAGSLVVL